MTVSYTHLDVYKRQFSTCVSRATLDDAPMASKDGESVLGNIHETAEIVERIRPVYNFKAPE